MKFPKAIAGYELSGKKPDIKKCKRNTFKQQNFINGL